MLSSKPRHACLLGQRHALPLTAASSAAGWAPKRRSWGWTSTPALLPASCFSGAVPSRGWPQMTLGLPRMAPESPLSREAWNCRRVPRCWQRAAEGAYLRWGHASFLNLSQQGAGAPYSEVGPCSVDVTHAGADTPSWQRLQLPESCQSRGRPVKAIGGSALQPLACCSCSFVGCCTTSGWLMAAEAECSQTWTGSCCSQTLGLPAVGQPCHCAGSVLVQAMLPAEGCCGSLARVSAILPPVA